jgi:hypothetical protein
MKKMSIAFIAIAYLMFSQSGLSADKTLLGASTRGSSVFRVAADTWVAQEFTLSERTKLSTLQLPMWIGSGGVNVVLTNGLSSSARVFSSKVVFGNFTSEQTVVIAWHPSIKLEAGTYYLVFMGADAQSAASVVSSDGSFSEPNGNSVGHLYGSDSNWDQFYVSSYPSVLFQLSGKQ